MLHYLESGCTGTPDYNEVTLWLVRVVGFFVTCSVLCMELTNMTMNMAASF